MNESQSMSGQKREPRYGYQDATFQAAGGEPGIRRLVDDFYKIMSSDPRFRRIFDWHPEAELAADKLARFLCGWMGGPKRYREKYGAINLPGAHGHLPITGVEKNMWLDCMREALELQDYPEDLKQYLMVQLSVPAERVRARCSGANRTLA